MRNAIDYILEKMPFGAQMEMDLSDPMVFDFVVESYDRAGFTHERCPGLHMQFHEMRRRVHRPVHAIKPTATEKALIDDGWQTGAQVTGIGKSETQGKAASTGYVTFVGGVATCLSVIQVIDPKRPPDDNVLATGRSSGFSDVTTLLLQTSSVAAQQLPDAELMVNILYTYQKTVGGPVAVINHTVPQSALGALQMPTVTQPVVKPAHAGNAMIKIGLGRGPAGQNKDDVDYWFWQGTNDTSYAVPFVGNVTFSAPIRTPLEVGVNFFPDFSLVRTDGGYKKLSGPALDAATAGFSVNGATLIWSLPSTDDPSTSKPINFGQLDWQVESNVYFNAQFPVTLTNNALGYAAVVSADKQQNNDQGIAYIKPLWFVYHCVAAGSLVGLADGSLLPIEDVTSRHTVVLDREGTAARVRGNRVAPHRGRVYRLSTETGRRLVMSYGHVVVTDEGPHAAQDLKIGSHVVTIDGAERIVELDSFDQDAPLYNIEIETDVEEIGATFFANGILCGDMVMQAHYRRTSRRNLDVILSRIDPIFHKDCLNCMIE